MMKSIRRILPALLAIEFLVVITPTAQAGYTGVTVGSVAEGGSLTLTAPTGAVFTAVVFASYGTPTATAPYTKGGCDATNSVSLATTAFLNKTTGTLAADNNTFGDPCNGTGKRLSVSMGYTYYLTNSAIPTISGTLNVGQTLTATSGTWANTPNSYAYQWQRAATSGGTYSNIASANSNTYVLTNADVGNYVRVVVTATNDAGSVAANSSPTASAIAGITSTTLSISGSPSTATYRVNTPISIGVTANGKVTVTANGKVIPGCKGALTSGLAFTCNWKPAIHGWVTLQATYSPTSAGYLASVSSTYKIQVNVRAGKR